MHLREWRNHIPTNFIVRKALFLQYENFLPCSCKVICTRRTTRTCSNYASIEYLIFPTSFRALKQSMSVKIKIYEPKYLHYPTNISVQNVTALSSIYKTNNCTTVPLPTSVF